VRDSEYTEHITSRRNPIVQDIKRLFEDKGRRDEKGEFACEGAKLYREALAAGVRVTCALMTREFLERGGVQKGCRAVTAPDDILKYVSTQKGAADVAFVCAKPAEGGLPLSGARHIVLDGVQDPGNVGTVIRTANALSIGSVILTGECADPYNPKSVRASMGAVFRQKFCHMSLTELKTHHESGMRIIGASPGEGSLDICKADLTHSAVAIGSEGGGLSGGVLSLCDEMIAIQIAPECESLNAAVAAAIIMWEMSRRGLR